MNRSFSCLGAVVLLATACDSPGSTSGAGGDSASTGVNGQTTGSQTDGSSGAGMSTGSGLPSESYTLTFGPLQVDAGTERTQCVTKRLGNMSTIHVGQIHNELIGVSHHLIVYKSTATQEDPNPKDCQPFADTLSSGAGGPLMITQKHDELLTLPSGVAFNLDPNQMIRLEVHYINPTAATASIQANATFYAMPEGEFQNEAGFLFAGNTAIQLAPNQTKTINKFIGMPSDLVGKSFFGFTGHVHQMGTNVVVGMGSSPQSLDPVYDVPNFAWNEPPTVYHDPPKVLGAGQGFDLTCDYDNTSNYNIGFGESANDEMCFFWAYYFPNAGPKIIF
ncbi:MAG: hypothetical protein U0414_17340 [Polyangiaceae bacterium]